jgi:uncharacterized protein
MGRVLFFLLLAVAVYLLWRSLRRDPSPRDPAPRPGSAERSPQAMVSCATCGLHVPRQEALPLGDRYFCCEEHRRHPPSA